MRRIITLVVVAVVMAAMMVFVGPAFAQGGGCKAFGQNVAGLGQSLGATFGQTASGNAPLNDTVAEEQQMLCR